MMYDSMTQDLDTKTENSGSFYQPIPICETYQTDGAELLSPVQSNADEMAIDQLYQSM